jgi:hypothetical protein
MDFCCFDEEKVRHDRKEKARLYVKSLAFLMHTVLLFHGKKQVYAWINLRKI